MKTQIMPFLSSNEIYEDILDRIVSLELKPREKISENQLAKEYNVSRAIIRQAFIRLVDKHFIKVLPNRGSYIAPINLEYIQDILLIRKSIEKEVVRTILHSNPDMNPMIEELSKNMDEQRKYTQDKTYTPEFKVLDSKFHSIIATTAKIKDYEKLLAGHADHLARWRNYSVMHGNTINKLIGEHEEIYKNICAKNECAVMKAIDNHLDTITDVIKKQISSNKFNA